MSAVDRYPGAGTAGVADRPPDDGRAGAGAGGDGTATRRRRPASALVGCAGAAVGVALAVAAVGYAAAAATGDDEAPASGPGEVTVQLDVEHSLFTPDELRVIEGTRVRFVVANGDPIGHELIVGPPDVHARHASGTEAEHPSIPGEVSVDPNGLAVTTFRFDEVGTFEFACHLPGHYEHGMHGVVEVVPADG